MIELERNIPVPTTRVMAPAKYPFAQMAVGDSFSLPLEAQTTNRLNSNIKYFKSKNSGTDFLVRTIRQEGIVRCWRTA